MPPLVCAKLDIPAPHPGLCLSASSSLSLHVPRNAPPKVLPLGCLGSFFHPFLADLPVFLGDSTAPGDIPTQTVQMQSILTARSRQGRAAWGSAPRTATSSPSCPPSATVQQPPKSPPATSHCLCPTVALTAALAQHRKAQTAPVLGNDHGLPWCALPASETRWPTETCWVGPERASTLVPFPTYSLDSIVEEL